MCARSDALTSRRLVVAGVALLCCVVLAFGWWSKARCLGPGGWSGGEQYTRWCYTDVYALWYAERLDEGAVPYLDHPVEYPVLTGAQMWAAAQVAEILPPERRAAGFFHATAALGAGAALGTLWLLARAGLPPRRLLWWAGAPTLALTAFVNWDPVPVALLVAGIVAHLRGRDGVAGVAAGLGAAAKLFPGLLVPLVVASRLGQQRVGDAARHAGAAAAVWLAVNLPVTVAAPEGWRRFLDLNRERPADWGSLWFLAEQVRGSAFAVSTVNAGSALLFFAGAAAIAVLGARRREPGRWWELALPLLVWFLLTNKVYSPQFSLWLLPLMALALPRSRLFLAFLVADTAAFLLIFPFLGGLQGFSPALGYPWVGAALALRAAVLLGVVVAGVRGSASAGLPAGGGALCVAGGRGAGGRRAGGRRAG